MRTTKRNSMSLWALFFGLFLLMSVQAQAVEFKNTYNGYRPTVGSYQAVAPTVSFHSTSAYSGQLGTAEVSMLNADGSINSEAYMGNTGPAKVGPRKNPPNPDVDDDDPGNVPIGDGLWVLMALAVGYLIIRAHRRVLKGPRSLGT